MKNKTAKKTRVKRKYTKRKPVEIDNEKFGLTFKPDKTNHAEIRVDIKDMPDVERNPNTDFEVIMEILKGNDPAIQNEIINRVLAETLKSRFAAVKKADGERLSAAENLEILIKLSNSLQDRLKEAQSHA